MNNITDRFERFSFDMGEIYKFWQKLTTAEMSKYGLRGIHSIYLLTLSRCPDGVTASKISELSGRDKADVSRMLSILKKNGFIYFDDAQGNRYRGLYKLTEKGKEALSFTRRRAEIATQYAGKDMTEEEREIFYRCMESIMKNMSELSETGIPEE